MQPNGLNVLERRWGDGETVEWRGEGEMGQRKRRRREETKGERGNGREKEERGEEKNRRAQKGEETGEK